jgi:cytoskeletal protein RodZ
MTGFGSALKSERERTGLTLQAIADQTKVSTRHLEALEEEDFGVLPKGVFRRGIARAYVLALGLDEIPWLERFQQSHEAYARASGETLPDEQAWAAFAENVKKNRVPTSQRTDIRWLGLLAMLIALAAAAWAVWHYILQSRLR